MKVVAALVVGVLGGIAMPSLAQAPSDTPTFSHIQSQANSGDSFAMQSMAEICLVQAEKSGDFNAALQWFHRAADAGRIEAMMRLRDIYSFQLRDKPGAKDEQNRWTRLAEDALEAQARKGDVTAQLHLAYVYELDDDQAAAMLWYRRAASSGSADAYYALSAKTKLGWGVEENPIESIRLLRVAASKKYVTAMRQLANDYDQGYGVQSNSELAQAWRLKADQAEREKADAGSLDAMVELGLRELREDKPGDGVQWLTRAAKAGSYQAATALALACTVGTSVPRNPDEAARWRAAAEDIGLPLSKYNWPEKY
jgi:TPR repeat protein